MFGDDARLIDSVADGLCHHDCVVLHLNDLCQWLSCWLGHFRMNAVACYETQQTGCNGYNCGNATAMMMARFPRFNFHATIDRLSLSAGRLDNLFVSDFIFHIS